MTAHVVAAVEVERLDHAVVARAAKILAVAVLAIALVGARDRGVVLPEVEPVRVAAQDPRRREHARVEARLQHAALAREVARGAARRRVQPAAPRVVAAEAQLHARQLGAGRELGARDVVAARAGHAARYVRLVIEAQVRRRDGHARVGTLRMAGGAGRDRF